MPMRLKFAISTTTVGALPDRLTFAPEGPRLLVANEGSPSIDGTLISAAGARAFSIRDENGALVWDIVPGGTAASLYSIWGCGAGDLYVAGSGGTVLRRSSGSFTSSSCSSVAIAFAWPACRSHTLSLSIPTHGAERKRIFEASWPDCLQR